MDSEGCADRVQSGHVATAKDPRSLLRIESSAAMLLTSKLGPRGYQE